MILSFDNVSVKKFDTCIIKDISFTVNKGDYLNIIGPNGSGKTTLIKVMTGLTKPTEGIVRFGEYKLGYIPQHLHNPKFIPATVYEVLKLSNLNKVKDSEIDVYLELMNISGLKYHKMKQLSGGESQRVYIIRALLSRPDVLILDEPTSALDPGFRDKFYNYIEALHNNGMTIVHVTHDLSDGLRRGSKIIQLDQTIRFKGTFEQFQNYHEHHHDEKGGEHYHV
ncbi:MAG: metal ABC transporter ATP-binding protein [Acholeplasmataceae bacterium]|nr:metal ABC transporter ATP-binding protein [Acholeplasmataceae bacterium]